MKSTYYPTKLSDWAIKFREAVNHPEAQKERKEFLRKIKDIKDYDYTGYYKRNIGNFEAIFWYKWDILFVVSNINMKYWMKRVDNEKRLIQLEKQVNEIFKKGRILCD